MNDHLDRRAAGSGFGFLKGMISANDIVKDDSDDPYLEQKNGMMKIFCKKDGVIAKPIAISSYEYEPGVVMQNVTAFECPKCHEFIFTPAQAKEMEARKGKLKMHAKGGMK